MKRFYFRHSDFRKRHGVTQLNSSSAPKATAADCGNAKRVGVSWGKTLALACSAARPGGGDLWLWTYREPLAGVHFNHSAQKILTVWRDEVRHVENSQLHLLQKIPQVVVIKRESALDGRRDRGHVNQTLFYWFNGFTSFTSKLCHGDMFSAAFPTSSTRNKQKVSFRSVRAAVWQDHNDFISEHVTNDLQMEPNV